MAAAISYDIQPSLAITKVKAITALEDWKKIVKMKPIPTNNNTLVKLKFSKCRIYWTKAELSSKAGIESFKNPNPRKSMANPMMNSAQDLLVFLPENNKGRLRAIKGRRITLILNVFPNPRMDTNQGVAVVPILAPIITPIASDNDKSPAFTKPIVITVVADDDCMAEVIKVPDRIPFTLLEVIAENVFLIFLPATF